MWKAFGLGNRVKMKNLFASTKTIKVTWTMIPIPIYEEKKSEIRKALDIITQLASLEPQKDYSAKLIQQAINVLHNELDRLYDKV